MDTVEQVAASVTVKTGTLVAAGSGLWGWLGTNQPQITALCGIIGLLVMVAGAVIKARNDRRRLRRDNGAG